MTKDEALKLALEALERGETELRWKAIATIKEALAQQCVCGEPNSAGTHRTDGPCLSPQRTWVGLTEAQCGVLWKTNMTPFEYYQVIEAKLKEKNHD